MLGDKVLERQRSSSKNNSADAASLQMLQVPLDLSEIEWPSTFRASHCALELSEVLGFGEGTGSCSCLFPVVALWC